MTAQIDPSIISSPHLRPLGDQVILLPVKDEGAEAVTEGGIYVNVRKSDGGIDLPDSVENEPVEGVVVALGDGYVEACATCYPNGKKHHFGVRLGDRVLYVPWLCTSITLDDVTYIISADRDLLGKFPTAPEASPQP